MLKNHDKYQICKLLDDQIRIIGLPLDEFIPVASIMLLAFILKMAIWGVIGGGIILMLVRIAKRGHGSGWLFYKIFWYAPAVIFKAFLFKTPASSLRHWLY